MMGESQSEIEQGLRDWSEENRISLGPSTGKATLTLPRIRQPSRAGLKTIEFSAYAFNENRVKRPPRE